MYSSFSDQKFGQIVSQPPPDLQVRMRDFVINHVFNELSDDDDQSDDENEGNFFLSQSVQYVIATMLSCHFNIHATSVFLLD